MSISPGQTTANNCKTAFSLQVVEPIVESASDDYNFWFTLSSYSKINLSKYFYLCNKISHY